jgi:hypothetical protein
MKYRDSLGLTVLVAMGPGKDPRYSLRAVPQTVHLYPPLQDAASGRRVLFLMFIFFLPKQAIHTW